MANMVYINLPVENLQRSTEFFGALGYTFKSTMTDENSTAMILEENVIVMLIVKSFFTNFITKEISDTSKYTEVLLSVSVNSKEEVIAFIEKARAAGAGIPNEAYEFPFMYGQMFVDPDGHTWEVIYMPGGNSE